MGKKHKELGCGNYLHMKGDGAKKSLFVDTSYCNNPHIIETLGLETLGIAPKEGEDVEKDYGVLTPELKDFCQVCPLNTSLITGEAEEAKLVKKLEKAVKSYLEDKGVAESQREAESYIKKKKSKSGDTTLILQ